MNKRLNLSERNCLNLCERYSLKSAVDKVPVVSINKEGLYERLLEREALTSTGIGKGVAIPHPRAPLPKEIDDSLITTC